MECYRTINFQSDSGMVFEANQQVTLNRIKIANDWVLTCQSKQDTSTPGMILKDLTFPMNKNPSGKFCLEVTGWANCRKAFVQIIDPENNQRQISGYQYLPQPKELIGSPKELIGSPKELIGSPKELIGSPKELIGSPTSVFVNFQIKPKTPSNKKFHLAILFGGTEKPAIGDQCWVKQILLTNKDLTEQPTALHQQDIKIRRDFDPKPLFLWKNPIPVAKKITTTEPSEPVNNSPEISKNLLQNLSKLSQLSNSRAIGSAKHKVNPMAPHIIQIPETNFCLSLEPDGQVRWFSN